MRFITLLTLWLALCGCSGEEEKSSEFIPDIQVECTSAQAADCSGNGYPVFVGLAQTLTADCDDYLAGQNATQRRQSFTASGTATTARNGIYLTATVSTWVNSVGGTADVLLAGTYQVCAFVDTNSNGVIDTNEPTGTGQVTAGTTGFVLDTWVAAFN